jgi:hypothetical protein
VEKLVENPVANAACTASNREFHAVCTTMVRNMITTANGTL